MKRKMITAIVLSALFVIGFAGCGNDKKEEATDVSVPTQEEESIEPSEEIEEDVLSDKVFKG